MNEEEKKLFIVTFVDVSGPPRPEDQLPKHNVPTYVLDFAEAEQKALKYASNFTNIPDADGKFKKLELRAITYGGVPLT